MAPMMEAVFLEGLGLLYSDMRLSIPGGKASMQV